MTAYLSLNDARAFAKERDMADSQFNDSQLTALLLRASEMIDLICAFRGHKADTSQLREWPRRDVEDEAGTPITGIPHAVISVTIQLAIALGEDEADAMRAIGLSDGITQERIGDIQVRYASSNHHLPPMIRRLWPYLRLSQPITVSRA